jgi:hypothetical protein
MDYVWGWHLIYRTRATMLALAHGLEARAASIGIASDVTERCLFLDVVKPTTE